MDATPSFTLYSKRRARVAAQLGDGGIAIVPTAPERQRNRDSDFPYRADSYFYYLTGFSEPNAWLVLTSDGRSTLFCQPKDLEREIWDGIRLGPEAAPAALGVDEAFPVDELNERLPRLLENRTTVWFPFATHAGLEGRIDGYWRPYHRTLDETMDALWARFGSAWHVNCHSMKSRTTAQDAEGPGHARVDIVLSDRDGQTCDRAFLEVAHEALRAEGLSVAINTPFKGAELVRRQGRPAEGRHALQIEFNRRLHLDEATLQKNERHPILHAMVDRLIDRLAAFCREQV